MVRDHNGRPLVRLGKLTANESKIEPVFGPCMPGHEAAIVTTVFAIANESVIVQLLPGKYHRRLRRPEEAIVGP